MFKTIKEWLKPGLMIKRWIAAGFLGIILLIQGIVEMMRNRMFSMNYMLYFGLLIASGIFIIYISISEGMKSFVTLVDEGMVFVDKESREVNSYMVEKKMQINGPRIVAIGGGTGLSTMLRGLKYYTSNITAVVTVGDDGGGSGTLRNEMGILPPGDIRNCLVALANTDELMEDLMQYRFREGNLKGQSFGNLFIAAMNGISDNFEDAVSRMSSVLAVTGKVLPVTLDDLRLEATLLDGSVISGESVIGISSSEENPIISLKVLPEKVRATDNVLTEIANAKAVIMGPGSLYTSVLPNLMISDVSKAISQSSGLKIYVCNILTQPGETDGYTVSGHLRAIMEKTELKKIDYVVVNSRALSDSYALGLYTRTGAKEVILDRSEVEKMGVKIVEGDIMSIGPDTVRHDPEKLAGLLSDLIIDVSADKGKMSALEYLLAREKKRYRERMIREEPEKTLD